MVLRWNNTHCRIDYLGSRAPPSSQTWDSYRFLSLRFAPESGSNPRFAHYFSGVGVPAGAPTAGAATSTLSTFAASLNFNTKSCCDFCTM